MGGRAAREPQLAAEVGAALDERHGVAVRGGLERGGHAGRAGADDERRAAPPEPPTRRGSVALAPRARVDGAADRDAGVVVADARLVAADARDDLVRRGRGAAFSTSSGSAISARVIPTASASPRGDEPLGRREVDHARRADHRDGADGRAHARERAGDRRRRGRRRRGDPGRGRHVRGVPERERGEVDEPRRAQRAGHLGAGRRVEALGRELVGGEPHADGEPGAGRRAHRAEHLLGEPQPRRAVARRRAGWSAG